VSEDKERKKEHDETKDQYFAILTCLRTSDVDFTYALIHLIKEIKKHDPNPALILVGTAGGPVHLQAARIQKAIKFDRGEMPDKKTIQIDNSLTVDETFPGIFEGATTHCSNWLMHFSEGDDYLDMESFEFCKVCKYTDIVDYACVRICSDTPEDTAHAILPIVKTEASNFGYDAKSWECSTNLKCQEKQRKVLQRILRKLTNFTNAVNEVIPVLKEYTLKRIRSIPNNNYESGKEKKTQEYLVHRLLNEKLCNIYCFPIQDEEYFTSSDSYLRKVINQLKTTQKQVWEGLAKEYNEASHA